MHIRNEVHFIPLMADTTEHVEDSDVILSLHVDFLDSAVLSYQLRTESLVALCWCTAQTHIPAN